MSRYVAVHLKDRQTAWNVATQQRIAATSSMLGGIKNIKMVGLQGALYDRIMGLRQHELDNAMKVRWINVAYNASGMYRCVSSAMIFLSTHSLPTIGRQERPAGAGVTT